KLGKNAYEWAAGGHLKYQVSEKLALGFGGQYYGNAFDRSINSNHHVVNVADGDDWAIGAVVDYKIAKGFDSKLAINYSDGDNVADGKNWGGFLRLQRNF